MYNHLHQTLTCFPLFPKLTAQRVDFQSLDRVDSLWEGRSMEVRFAVRQDHCHGAIEGWKSWTKIFCATCADTKVTLLLNYFFHGIVHTRPAPPPPPSPPNSCYECCFISVVLQCCHIKRTFESSYYVCSVTEIISYFQTKYALLGTVTRNRISASENAPFCGLNVLLKTPSNNTHTQKLNSTTDLLFNMLNCCKC